MAKKGLIDTATGQEIADADTRYFGSAAGTINALTEKTTVVDDDLLLIEDSEDSNNKKKSKISTVKNTIITPYADRNVPWHSDDLTLNETSPLLWEHKLYYQTTGEAVTRDSSGTKIHAYQGGSNSIWSGATIQIASTWVAMPELFDFEITIEALTAKGIGGSYSFAGVAVVWGGSNWIRAAVNPPDNSTDIRIAWVDVFHSEYGGGGTVFNRGLSMGATTNNVKFRFVCDHQWHTFWNQFLREWHIYVDRNLGGGWELLQKIYQVPSGVTGVPGLPDKYKWDNSTLGECGFNGSSRMAGIMAGVESGPWLQLGVVNGSGNPTWMDYRFKNLVVNSV